MEDDIVNITKLSQSTVNEICIKIPMAFLMEIESNMNCRVILKSENGKNQILQSQNYYKDMIIKTVWY